LDFRFQAAEVFLNHTEMDPEPVLRESLQQQTATADVLKVISSSPGELEPVFQAMLKNATRICEAKFGTLYLSEGDGFRAVAMHNAPPAYADARRRALIHPHPGTWLWHAATTKQISQIADITTIQPYVERHPFLIEAVELGGYRTVLDVPMLKEGELIGVVAIHRQEVRPFTDESTTMTKYRILDMQPAWFDPSSRQVRYKFSCSLPWIKELTTKHVDPDKAFAEAQNWAQDYIAQDPLGNMANAIGVSQERFATRKKARFFSGDRILQR
jgi:GAF domain